MSIGERRPVSETKERLGISWQQINAVLRWRRKRWLKGMKWLITDWTNDLCGEAGELANLGKKLRRLQMGMSTGKVYISKEEQDAHEHHLKRRMEEEIGDVFVCLVNVTQELGLDMETAILNKFNNTSVKHGFPERLRWERIEVPAEKEWRD